MTDEEARKCCGVVLFNKADKIIGVRPTEVPWPEGGRKLSETLAMLPGPLTALGAVRFGVTTVYRAMIEGMLATRGLHELQGLISEWKKLGLSFELLKQSPVQVPTFGKNLKSLWKGQVVYIDQGDTRIDLEDDATPFVSEPPPEWANAISRLDLD